MGLFILVLLLLLLSAPQLRSQSDAQCLKEFRDSVDDRQGILSSWGTNSGTDLCSASGVLCLHPSELKVYSLNLPQAGLSGEFPKGLSKCQSLTGLNLSGNNFTGPIPRSLCGDLPYLVNLDLSGNTFTGSIPEELGQCQYLNKLDLQNNQLVGAIPGQLGALPRLKDLNIAGNQLTGEIPGNLASQPRSNFDNNDLCGRPVSKDCNGGKSNVGLIAGAVAGGAIVLLATALVVYFIFRRRPKKMSDDSTWVKKIRAPRGITVSMFEEFLVKIKLSDLLAATDSFSKNNVIDAGPSGVSYKATLRDGSVLAVKRLISSTRSEQQFRGEMDTLGRVRHPNLVPLLGYCIAGTERLLIYKHMSNGSLWNWLYEAQAGERLDWPARLKIALGTARGLAFLHHSCSPRILHRNVCPRTILLDDDFDARITDFGLVRLMSNNHVNSDVVVDYGDPGHIAPEYARVPISTTKGDVYSFGVVLLELLTSQKPVDLTIGDFKGNLVEWIGTLYSSGRSSDGLDKSLLGRGADEELLQALKVACSCVLFLPKDRPSMYEVFQQLRRLGEKYDFTDQDDEIVIAANAPAAAESPGTTTVASATTGNLGANGTSS